jgi:opacity protein-like surface antigen
MKTKVISLLVVYFLALSILQAQNPVFGRGRVSFAAGYGFLSTWYLTKDISFSGDTPDGIELLRDSHYKVSGPVYAKFEVGVCKHLGLGLNFAWASNTWESAELDYQGENQIEYKKFNNRTTYSILFRVNAHFGPFKKFDPYVGAGIGFRDSRVNFHIENAADSSGVYDLPATLGWEIDVGLRYYVTPWLAAYAEIGLSKSLIQTGIVFSIPVNRGK